jgi:hypothetical protein
MSSDDDGKLILYATIGFGAGIFWFFKGFKIFREYRVLVDTPEVPIRSMAMGLVEIHGKAKLATEALINSPVSGTPCLFYKVDIEKYHRDSKGNGSWRHYKTDCNGQPFYLDDGSGKVLVMPYGAEYDLIQSARREAGGFGISSSFTKFASFRTNRPNFGKLFSGIDAPSTPATATTSTAASAATSVATAAVAAAPVTPKFVSESDLIAYAMSASSVVSSGLSSVQLGGVSLGGLSMALGSGSGGRFRFTEYCILPDHWYDVTGTCAENPQPRDESDRNIITQGKNEPTFVISWRSEKEIEGTLRKRALKYIFGGAGLAIACMAFLLAKFGWLF